MDASPASPNGDYPTAGFAARTWDICTMPTAHTARQGGILRSSGLLRVVPTRRAGILLCRHNREDAMAYVRKKKLKGQEYYQLVEGRRENGKVKQRVLCHLGQYPTVDVALERIPFLIKIAPRGGFSRKAVLSGNQYTPQTHDHLLEYDHEKRWMNREATTGFLQDKLTLLRAIREQGKA